jgi:hypothetical protein
MATCSLFTIRILVFSLKCEYGYLHDDWIGLDDHMVHIAPSALNINHTYIYSG